MFSWEKMAKTISLAEQIEIACSVVKGSTRFLEMAETISLSVKGAMIFFLADLAMMCLMVEKVTTTFFREPAMICSTDKKETTSCKAIQVTLAAPTYLWEESVTTGTVSLDRPTSVVLTLFRKDLPKGTIHLLSMLQEIMSPINSG